TVCSPPHAHGNRGPPRTGCGMVRRTEDAPADRLEASLAPRKGMARMPEQDELAAQHERFKQLMGDLVRHLLFHGFEDAWEVQCYRSKEAFASRYGDAGERGRALDQIDEQFRALRIAMGSLLSPNARPEW